MQRYWRTADVISITWLPASVGLALVVVIASNWRFEFWSHPVVLAGAGFIEFVLLGATLTAVEALSPMRAERWAARDTFRLACRVGWLAVPQVAWFGFPVALATLGLALVQMHGPSSGAQLLHQLNWLAALAIVVLTLGILPVWATVAVEQNGRCGWQDLLRFPILSLARAVALALLRWALYLIGMVMVLHLLRGTSDWFLALLSWFSAWLLYFPTVLDAAEDSWLATYKPPTFARPMLEVDASTDAARPDPSVPRLPISSQRDQDGRV